MVNSLEVVYMVDKLHLSYKDRICFAGGDKLSSRNTHAGSLSVEHSRVKLGLILKRTFAIERSLCFHFLPMIDEML